MALVPQLIKPGYALLLESEVRTASRTVDRRLRDRLQAAIVVKPFLEQATTAQPPTLPPEVQKLSLEHMAKYLLFRDKSDHDHGDVKNLHARVQRSSLDASTIEFNAALRTIVRRDSGERYREMLSRMVKKSGIETPTTDVSNDCIDAL
jgi:hypothetical protein